MTDTQMKRYAVGDTVGVRPHGTKEVRLYGQPVHHGQKAKQIGRVLVTGASKCLVAYGKAQRWHFYQELWTEATHG